MAVSFSVTVTFSNQATRAIETALIHRALELAKADVRGAGGGKTSGTIMDGTFSLGTWSYTPGAGS